MNSIRSFTLLELLIVIGILAILASAAVIVLNPVDILKRARDSARITDLKTIDKALAFYQTDGGSSFGTSTVIYVSIPDSSATCANLGLSSPPSGWSYACALTSTYRKVDGSGWIPVNFDSISIGSPLTVLPIDPINSTSTGNYYSYVTGGSWVLASILESEKYLKQNALNDNGSDHGRYEVGNDLQLWTNATGLVGYWKFDESSGTSASDSSGNNNNGTTNGTTWGIAGKVGNAIRSANAAQTVTIYYNLFPNSQTNITVMAWVKINDSSLSPSPFIAKSRGIGTFSYVLALNPDLSKRFGARVDTNLQPSGATIWSATTNDGNWHFIALSRNSSDIRLYVDGAQQSSASLAGDILYGDRNIIFASPYNANTLFDEIRIYNRSLSAEEINAVYNATK